MRKYRFWHAFFMSFYSRDFYRDVAINWGANAYGYLLLLVGLVLIPFTINLQHIINLKFNDFSTYYAAQIPSLTIKNGYASTPEAKAYYVRDEKGQVIAIIDTTKRYTSLDQVNANFLVTDNAIISKQKPHETTIREFSKNLNLTINAVSIRDTLQKFIRWTWVLIFPVSWIAVYIFRLFQALCYALLGYLYAGMTQSLLKFRQVLRLTVVALTPSIVVNMLASVMHYHFIYPTLFSFLVTLFYIFFSINANRHQI